MVTAVTHERRLVFADAAPSDILLEAVLFGRKQGWYYIFAFVIMPDHLHMIITPKDKNISECVKSIKGFSSRRINTLLSSRGSLWQRGFFDHILDTEEKVLSRIRYIEENPVRKGLVEKPEEYKYSSFRLQEETDLEMLF
ncbi:MAG: transposase [Deltaproteobacteria bacterium]|nr:transposase [Deltaproteobacteria bacterium]